MSFFHLGWSLFTVALVGAALGLIIYLIRCPHFQKQSDGSMANVGEQQQKDALLLFKGDLWRLLKSTPLVTLLVLIAGCLTRHIDGVFVMRLLLLQMLFYLKRKTNKQITIVLYP
jgi:dipeptide/tripeptide permease